jgi:hypothetical protein
MGDEIRRAHDIDELRVEGPTPGGSEVFGFDEELVGSAGGGGEGEEEGG